MSIPLPKALDPVFHETMLTFVITSNAVNKIFQTQRGKSFYFSCKCFHRLTLCDE